MSAAVMQAAPAEQFVRYGELLKAAEGIDLDDAARRFLWNVARWGAEDAQADALALIAQLRRGPFPDMNLDSDEAAEIDLDAVFKGKREDGPDA